jgi:hypothetical protein
MLPCQLPATTVCSRAAPRTATPSHMLQDIVLGHHTNQNFCYVGCDASMQVLMRSTKDSPGLYGRPLVTLPTSAPVSNKVCRPADLLPQTQQHKQTTPENTVSTLDVALPCRC